MSQHKGDAISCPSCGVVFAAKNTRVKCCSNKCAAAVRCGGPKVKRTTRPMQPGEACPTSTPKKYMASNGYVRLVWRVGRQSYVWTYEHRFITGMPVGEVHHIDGNKTNNNPSNLQVVASTLEHRRFHRQKVWDIDAGLAMLMDGASIASVGRKFNVDESVVQRMVRRRGFTGRRRTTLTPDQVLAIRASSETDICASESVRNQSKQHLPHQT